MMDALLLRDEEHRHSHAQNRFAAIPIAEKLKSGTRFTGKGICIAFLDSGFYPHPDFAGRVIAFHDISGQETSFHSIGEPEGHHWHGTQTVTLAAGNGALSDGVYRGIASDADLVLVKVSQNGRISDESIEKGLRWVLDNRCKFNIRVLNISLGGDLDATFAASRINNLAEELVEQGVCITVAAGNSSESHSIPPASAPSVITVGGYSDENQFSPEKFELYHSNFGATADGLLKPEVIAPAMHVAAPILPGTDQYRAAEALSLLAAAPDYAFRSLLDRYSEQAGLPELPDYQGLDPARKLVEQRLRQRKIVATHYQSVDGTSFAAPVTASVVAQMLEANPRLTPLAVKNILCSTARRLADRPLVRQGYGVLNAGLALAETLRERHSLTSLNYSPPRAEDGRIVFHFHGDAAREVFLAGDFNDWNPSGIPFAKGADGIWRVAIEQPAPGRYRYKLLIDNELWIEDASHTLKEEDGFGGFHSILIVE